MKDSHIEWTDNTFNPWEGCTEVSPGCAKCYAKLRDGRFHNGIHWGKGAPRRRTSPENWKKPLLWDRISKRDLHEFQTTGAITNEDGVVVAREYRRPRVFCASLADWLDAEVPIEWLADLLSLIHQTPNLEWQLLTKRPENFQVRLIHAALWMTGYRDGQTQDTPSAPPSASEEAIEMVLGWSKLETYPANVEVGTTVEDQTRANLRVPLLLKIPAKIRFLSMEPLLERVSFRWAAWHPIDKRPGAVTGHLDGLKGIHWIICGGESGSEARPMHPEWAYEARDQATEAGIPFLFKQWGEWCPRGPESFGYPVVEDVPRLRMTDTGEDGSRLEAGGDNQVWMNRAGKKKAGRMLQGREWNEFPAEPAAEKPVPACYFVRND